MTKEKSRPLDRLSYSQAIALARFQILVAAVMTAVCLVLAVNLASAWRWLFIAALPLFWTAAVISRRRAHRCKHREEGSR